MCWSTDRGLYQIVPDYGTPARSSRLFSEGQHYVEYRAVDGAGKVASCSFTVTVHGQFAHLLPGLPYTPDCVSLFYSPVWDRTLASCYVNTRARKSNHFLNSAISRFLHNRCCTTTTTTTTTMIVFDDTDE